jgi:UDP-N-acetylmuramoyl-L-alanyl-D-glutamate--2,6-diaminopimelate ligase
MIRNIKNYIHKQLAKVANWRYDYPSKQLRVIGVTGTDGKTTTSSLIYHILRSVGKRASLISTVYAKIGDTEHDTGFHVSTPNSFVVQRMLRESVAAGDQFFVLETTSHALDQNRVYGVHFEIGVITNITHEHLDYHKTYERYVDAKMKLLHQSKKKIVNEEDESFAYVLKQYSRQQVKTYGLKHGTYTVDYLKEVAKGLPEFNTYNYLAAFAVADALKIPRPAILEALKTFALPTGRMEVVREHPVTAIVDFAHTPHSLKAALTAVRNQYCGEKGRLIHIFGCAAERDTLKRPIMGEISGSTADIVILTEEDARRENPVEIAEEIATGLHQCAFERVSAESVGTKNNQYTIIPNRGDAVIRAVAISRPGDCIILTGKGHEQSICRGTVEYPWNDGEAVRNALSKRYDM